MKLKQAAHNIVQSIKKRHLHEVAIEGAVFVRGEARHGWMVTLTFKNGDGPVYQGVGASYFNPSDPSYSQKYGYTVARGRAELALGVKLLKDNIDFWDDFPEKRAKSIILDSVHRLPGDVRWKSFKSKRARRNTSSMSQTPDTQSPRILGSVHADSQAVSAAQSYASFYSPNNTLNAPSAGQS